jgi:hypothetical protein
MFNRASKGRDQKLDDVEDAILGDMLYHGPKSETYGGLLDALERVTAIKSKEKRNWSWDSVIYAAAHVGGIVVIVAYEQRHAFTSKGLSQVLKRN